MDKEKFARIIRYNTAHEEQIRQDCIGFYHQIGRETPTIIPDIVTCAAFIFANRNYRFIHMPLKDKEIGAFHLFLGGTKYIVLNTTQSRANNNFALAHELHHVLFGGPQSGGTEAEFYLSKYNDNEDEMRANAFAGSILMPKEDFRSTALNFRALAKNMAQKNDTLKPLIDLQMIYSLMIYYRVTYMSVVIRCYELGILNQQDDTLLSRLLRLNDAKIHSSVCDKVAHEVGRNSIMEPSYEDDFHTLLKEAEQQGKKFLEMGYMTDEDYEYRTEGMRTAYDAVREERQNDGNTNESSS